jgi:regulator of sirC expression with transglutaminase-like and TPR domain
MMACAPNGDNEQVPIAPFVTLAAEPEPPIEDLALSLAAEFKEIDEDAALTQLDELGAEVAEARSARTGSRAGVEALREVLAERHGFRGDSRGYDHPDNSMLNVVLERRRGLPILLSVLYLAVARRAGIPLSGVGLPGHYVVGDFVSAPPVLVDPFAGGTPIQPDEPRFVRQWTVHETILRMLNNLVGSYGRRADLSRTIQAAELRLALPLEEQKVYALRTELGALRARLN